METDEMIWVGTTEKDGACHLSDDEGSIACHHYQAKTHCASAHTAVVIGLAKA